MRKVEYPFAHAGEVPAASIHRENGAEVFVFAKKFRGEAGSLAIPDTVEVTHARDAMGNLVTDLTDEEWQEAQRAAERRLA